MVRKSTTHVALDRKANRYTLHEAEQVVAGCHMTRAAVHDNQTGRETVLFAGRGKERHAHPWTRNDYEALVDWLNERAAGYPRSGLIGHLHKLKWSDNP